MDRLYLVAIGDGSLKDFRIAGAALGRKAKGKAVNLISLLPTKADEDISIQVGLVFALVSRKTFPFLVPRRPISTLTFTIPVQRVALARESA